MGYAQRYSQPRLPHVDEASIAHEFVQNREDWGHG